MKIVSDGPGTNRGLWSKPDVPHKGWRWLHVNDYGEPCHTCEFCQTAECRYTHVIEHPDYPDQLEVGCMCAEHLTQMPKDELKAQEARIRTAAKRRARLLANLTRELPWRPSAKGNPWCKITRRGQGEYAHAVVYRAGARWVGRLTIQGQTESDRFSSKIAAQRAVEDALYEYQRNELLGE